MKFFILSSLLFFSLNSWGITQKDFFSILDQLEKDYIKISEENGTQFIFNKNWEDSSLNAFATKFGDQKAIIINGGMARHPLIDEDAFTLMACHEIGHHFGGAPKKYGVLANWSSVEGQADFFATSECFKRYLIATPRIEKQPSFEGIERCRKRYRNKDQRYICLRSLKAVETLAAYLGENRGYIPSLLTPDPFKAKKTVQWSLNPQCRFDTLVAGVFCDKDVFQPFDEKDPSFGACYRNLGSRPACWFVPKVSSNTF